jgi:tol-pal system protein YbgF
VDLPGGSEGGMMRSMKKLLCTVSLVSLVVGTSACLKTRAQLRDEDDREASKPIAVQPAQDVRPQGQYVIDEIKAEITQLTGRVEDLERGQKELKEGGGNRDDFKKLEAKVAQLEQVQNQLQEIVNKLQESPALVNPNELFEKAKSQFEDEHYEAAAESFGSYIKIPKVKKLEEATFLRGESYYKLKQYKKAIVEYSKFPEKFSRSSRMPEVLYKIGLSFEALSMKDEAKGFYQELLEKYPKSPEAKKARKKVK